MMMNRPAEAFHVQPHTSRQTYDNQQYIGIAPKTADRTRNNFNAMSKTTLKAKRTSPESHASTRYTDIGSVQKSLMKTLNQVGGPTPKQEKKTFLNNAAFKLL